MVFPTSSPSHASNASTSIVPSASKNALYDRLCVWFVRPRSVFEPAPDVRTSVASREYAGAGTGAPAVLGAGGAEESVEADTLRRSVTI